MARTLQNARKINVRKTHTPPVTVRSTAPVVIATPEVPDAVRGTRPNVPSPPNRVLVKTPKATTPPSSQCEGVKADGSRCTKKVSSKKMAENGVALCHLHVGLSRAAKVVSNNVKRRDHDAHLPVDLHRSTVNQLRPRMRAVVVDELDEIPVGTAATDINEDDVRMVVRLECIYGDQVMWSESDGSIWIHLVEGEESDVVVDFTHYIDFLKQLKNGEECRPPHDESGPNGYYRWSNEHNMLTVVRTGNEGDHDYYGLELNCPMTAEELDSIIASVQEQAVEWQRSLFPKDVETIKPAMLG